MTAQQRSLTTLGQLVDLREREVDRLSTDLAAREAMRRRCQGNIDRLHALCEGSGPSGALPVALSLNCAAYKQALLQVAQDQRNDLVLHQSEVDVARAALHDAARRHESLDQLVAKRRQRLAREQSGREQKRQDDLATQVWQRGQR